MRSRLILGGFVGVAVVLSITACSGSGHVHRQLQRLRDPIARVTYGLPPGWMVPTNCCALQDPNPPRLLVTSFKLAAWDSAEDCFGAPRIVARSPQTAVLVFLLEDVGSGLQFPHRPTHFSLPHTNAELVECVGPSYRLRFEDAGRRFQAFVVVRPRATATLRNDAMEVLDNFHADRRRY